MSKQSCTAVDGVDTHLSGVSLVIEVTRRMGLEGATGATINTANTAHTRLPRP